MIIIEKELRDRTVSARINLGLEIINVCLNRRAVGMFLGICGNRNFKPADFCNPGHQVSGIGVAMFMRGVWVSSPLGRVASERHDMTHSGIPIRPDHLIHLIPARPHTGEMGRGF